MSVPKWRRYLRFWSTDVDADVDDEFRFHFETEVEELVAGGMPHEAAREEALRRFGDVDFHRRFLTAAVRGDDNSAFGEEYSAAYYPKFSASWVISEVDPIIALRMEV